MLIIAPKAFIGWYRDFRIDGHELQMGGTSMDEAAGAWYNVDSEHLTRHRVANAEEIVYKLGAMYYEAVPKSLVRYGSLREAFMEFMMLRAVAEPGS